MPKVRWHYNHNESRDFFGFLLLGCAGRLGWGADESIIVQSAEARCHHLIIIWADPASSRQAPVNGIMKSSRFGQIKNHPNVCANKHKYLFSLIFSEA